MHQDHCGGVVLQGDLHDLPGIDTGSVQGAAKHFLNSVSRYIDGLVRYLHGLKAKDHQSDITTFESFDQRFSQALASLSDYTTPLAAALRAVIRFNRNDFGLMHCASGLPDLDRAIAFFYGNDLVSSAFASPDAQLPVDQASEFILANLIPVFSDSTRYLYIFSHGISW